MQFCTLKVFVGAPARVLAPHTLHLDDRFHEPGIEKPTPTELEGCWWIPRLRRSERGAVSWQPGGKRLKWR